MLKVALVFLCVLMCYGNAQEKRTDDGIKLAIVITAIEQGIDPLIFLAQAKTESGFNPKAISPVEYTRHSNHGLFQIQPPTARSECGISGKQLYDPVENMLCAAKINKKNLDKFHGDYNKMILAYSAGDYIVCRTGRTKSGKLCHIGRAVNIDYLLTIRDNYRSMLEEFKTLKIYQFGTVDFIKVVNKFSRI